ncbi:hypothetical protein OG730_05660 [Streptomyces sp. NBC_01298]|uniref:hypothetical protein n=1 Tax=Streptomyces sp. NBC_01298 TaxID=2903817 RepID=UPI002E0DF4B2|nr:hypothetical protein OG730_05660 [Streptomyces sp. NBC_01298]
MSETDPHRVSATLELLALLTGGAPAPAAASATAPADPPIGRLGPPADREQQLRRRSALRARLTDGIVELRKRRPSEAPW